MKRKLTLTKKKLILTPKKDPKKGKGGRYA